jgi:unsaturated rhamnogalacturonyl hydrolase
MEKTFGRAFYFLGLVIFCLSLASCATKAASPQNFSGATPLEWSVRLADSEMARLGDKLVWKEGGTAKWDYTAGLFTLSLLKLNEQIPDPRYVKFSEDAIGSFVASNGIRGYNSDSFKIQTYNPKEFQLDAINSGKTLLALWLTVTNPDNPRLFYGCAKLMEQFNDQPRTFDGGFWHKQRYTNQMWLDGIYMGAPFYAAMGRYSQKPQPIYDDVAKQFRLIDEHTYDAKTGLNYHGWDAAKVQSWANPATGCSSNFWGRAMGWYAMALVDTLDYFPTNHPARPQIIATLKKLSADVVKFQDAKTGLWWQVMDQGGRQGNYLEATASAMFVYALAKGVNHGYLSRDYATAAVKGYGGIVKNLIKDDGGGKWSLTQCCSVAGLGGSPSNGKMRDGSFDYYVSEPVVSNDLKGVGPFILAGIELQQLTRTNIQ